MCAERDLLPGESVTGYTRSAIEAGARVFKVHVQVGAFDPADARLDGAWGLLADAGIPVVVHAASGPVPGAHTGPEPFAAVLRRHPNLVAVIAHLGAPEYTAFFALADQYERVHLDTTMAFTPFFEAQTAFPDALVPGLRELGLAGKILFGSDFPNLPYAYADQLTHLAALDLGDDWLRAVCWHNAASLLQLKNPALEPPAER
jgi:predicted TIM-barrel fold metal-dependent hydrolase